MITTTLTTSWLALFLSPPVRIKRRAVDKCLYTHQHTHTHTYTAGVVCAPVSTLFVNVYVCYKPTATPWTTPFSGRAHCCLANSLESCGRIHLPNFPTLTQFPNGIFHTRTHTDLCESNCSRLPPPAATTTPPPPLLLLVSLLLLLLLW